MRKSISSGLLVLALSFTALADGVQTTGTRCQQNCFTNQESEMILVKTDKSEKGLVSLFFDLFF